MLLVTNSNLHWTALISRNILHYCRHTVYSKMVNNYSKLIINKSYTNWIVFTNWTDQEILFSIDVLYSSNQDTLWLNSALLVCLFTNILNVSSHGMTYSTVCFHKLKLFNTKIYVFGILSLKEILIIVLKELNGKFFANEGLLFWKVID